MQTAKPTAQTGSLVQRLVRSLIIPWVSILVVTASAAAPLTEREQNEVRAAFVFNLARFVNWPQASVSGNKAFNLCIYRNNYLGEAIDILTGKEIHGLPLIYHVISERNSAAKCQVLLIPPDDLADYQRESPATANPTLLTITDLSTTSHEHADHAGVMVTLVRKKTTLGFEIDLEIVEKSPLKISSELLKLALIVGDDE